MKFNNMYCHEYKDNFNLFNLIKKINKNYRLFFDEKHRMFLIVNIAKNCEICLNFCNFKQNILKLLNFTRVENSKEIFNFIENNNKNLIELSLIKNSETAKNKMSEIQHYTKRTNSFNFKDIKNYIEEKQC